MKKTAILLLLPLIIIISLFAAPLETNKILVVRHPFDEYAFNNTDTTYRIIPSSDGRYGYEILIKGKGLIRQLSIPGRAGTEGFKSKADAKKVAELVLKKLSQGMMPPTIEESELIKLKIKF